MSQQYSKKMTALFLITVVLAMPLYSSMVFADTFTVSASGRDNIPTYYRGEGDTWKFNIGASIAGDSKITPDQIVVNGYAGSARLDELGGTCGNGSGALTGNTCSFSAEYKPSLNIPFSNEFTFDLYDDNSSKVMTEKAYLYADLFAPSIEFTSDPVQSQDKVSFSYRVNERSYLAQPNSKCVGLSTVTLKSKDTVLEEIKPEDPASCYYESQATYLVSALPSQSVTITACDKFNHCSSKSTPSFVVDTGVPVIRSIAITRNSRELSYLKGEQFEADITVMITENNLNQASVVLDLSPIGGKENDIASYCTKLGDDYRCVWSKRIINVQSEGTKTIRAYAEDVFGNKGQADLQFSFKVDANVPYINYLRSSIQYNDKNYIGLQPVNLTMGISETGAGIVKEDIAIDLQDLYSFYSSEQQPDSCQKITDTDWECYWKNIFTEKSGRLRIDVTKARDLAGNNAEGTTSYFIYVENQEPQLLDLRLRSLSENQPIEGIVTSGSSVIITAQIMEETSIRAVGDFSKLKNDATFSSVPGECELMSENTWRCAWQVDSLISGYANPPFELKFYDIAENELKVSDSVEIYGIATQSPNFWSLAVKSNMPPAIDRSTSEIINHLMVFNLDLASAQKPTLLSSSLVGCTGDTDYLMSKGSDILINSYGKTNPYIVLTFKKFSSQKIDAFDVTCTFETKSIYNKVIYPPEYDNVTMHIPLFNSALGEASESTKKKIEDLKETYIRGWWKYIGGLNTLFNYASEVCRIFYAIRQITDVWHKIELTWGGVQKASTVAGAVSLPVAAAANVKRVLACEATEAAKEAADTGWGGFFNKFCGFVNCKLGPMPPEEQGRKTATMNKLSILGGRAQLCGPLTDALGGDMIKQWTGKESFGAFGNEEYGRYSNPSGYMNVKDSMVLSVCSLCLPGIIYNMQKYRQIQCMYIDCLERSVETGVPADTCDGMKDYSTCKYVLGEVFQFIPITAFLQFYLDKVKRAVSDPFSIIGLGFGIGCRHYCYAPDEAALAGAGHQICIGAKILADIGDIADNVKAIFDEDTWAPKQDYCTIIADADEKAANATTSSTSRYPTTSTTTTSGSTATPRNTRVDGVYTS